MNPFGFALSLPGQELRSYSARTYATDPYIALVVRYAALTHPTGVARLKCCNRKSQKIGGSDGKGS